MASTQVHHEVVFHRIIEYHLYTLDTYVSLNPI